ncbi:MAG: AbrB/MazE/SpoVT family DNA-binding domain-containing protein [Thermincola sp.]|nr:AbrB/MazE/SpoVT family DNA-binding domain-containing protein [Thermincola sp.]MDT3704673.1 AbrB/MazE/SpoVT family DNA-binding domain-containing protein [Thermincola sp.]
MLTTIQKWGNSQGIRIPKNILETASLRENDKVEILAEPDCIIIRRSPKKHLTIEERFKGYIGEYRCHEADTGKSTGNEVW